MPRSPIYSPHTVETATAVKILVGLPATPTRISLAGPNHPPGSTYLASFLPKSTYVDPGK